MRTIVTISPTRKVPLNRISEFLMDHHMDLIERLDGFELIAGTSNFLGAGDPPVERIVLTAIFEVPDKSTKADLDKIIALIKEKADDLKIELNVKQQ